MKYLLQSKTQAYYYKRKVPYIQRNFVISLRTDSLREAKFLISIINPKFETTTLNIIGENPMEWEEKLSYLQNLIAKYIEEAKIDYSKQRVAREQRYAYTTKDGKNRSGSHPKAIDRALDELTEITFSADEKLRKEKYNEIISSSQMQDEFKKAEKVLNDNQFKPRLLDEVFKAEIEMLQNDKYENEERIKNIAHNRPETALKLNNSLNIIPNPIQAEIKQNNRYYEKTTKEVINLFLENIGVKEIHKYKKPLEVFLELTNKEYLEDISSEDMLDFLNLYKNMPNENGKVNKEDIRDRTTYRSFYLKKLKNYTEWINFTIEHDLERIAGKTLKDKLIRISAFIDFAVGLEYIKDNRLKYHQLNINKQITREDDDDERRKSYRIEQLENLFSSSWYEEQLEENLEKNPSRIWIPLIMAHTGGRTNEISQIKVKQIKRRDNVLIFDLKNEDDDQRIKNKSSKRKVPIHDTLINLGFLEFLEKQKEKGAENLFDDLYHTVNKGYGLDFGKDFLPYREEFLENETIEKILKGEILLDTYSFRHTFATQLRKAKISEDDIGLILGHKKNQTQHYGEMPLDVLKEKMDMANYNLEAFKDLGERIREFYKKNRVSIKK